MTSAPCRALPGVRYNPRPVKRFGRILLNCFTALSLILFVATVALWVRSYWAGDGWQAIRISRGGGLVEQTTRSLVIGRGGLGAESVTSRLTPEYAATFGVDVDALRNSSKRVKFEPAYPEGFPEAGNTGQWAIPGFSFSRIVPGPPPSSTASQLEGVAVVLPLWFIALALATVPGLRTIAAARRRRERRRGLCQCCGYDLRATPERCPECGALTAQP
jgi:hypothetical protein